MKIIIVNKALEDDILELAEIYNTYRPILFQTTHYSNINELKEFLEKHGHNLLIKDECNITSFSIDRLMEYLKVENSKNKYNIPLYNEDKYIQNVDIDESAFGDYYTDDYGYLWEKLNKF